MSNPFSNLYRNRVSLPETRFPFVKTPTVTQMHAVGDEFHPLEVDKVRKDFPIFAGDSPLAYLDSAASSQTAICVVEAMADYYQSYRSNIHRGIYRISEEATAAYEEARQKVAQFINARRSSQVVFTRNTTESINLVAYSWGSANVRPRRRNPPLRDGTPQ